MVRRYIILNVYFKPEKLNSSRTTKIIKAILENGYEVSFVKEITFIKRVGEDTKVLELVIDDKSTYMHKMVIKAEDPEIADKLESLIKELKLE